MGRPKSELEGFNTIVALILCSFWLLDSQMFTGLALQIAKEIGLNSINSTRTEKNGLNKKDKLKLWYLLYVLDGQQSLTFNRQPLVDANDYTLKNVRGLLLHAPTKEIKNKESNVEKEEIGIKQSNTTISTVSSSEMASNGGFTDLRLISQVEYNQALNAAFNGNAWDLLSPASFGMPSKSNLELDKWMVSWTVLLSPVSNGAVWSSKSTLIYYNFAKMHINSSSVRNLQTSSTTDGMLPKWESSSKIEQLDDVNNRTDVEIDSEDESDDEDEFISNKELVSENQTIVNANIAVNAASTVLNLVVNDNDILNNLKYVPVHIHIMLYYAALLLVNPPLESNNKLITVTQEQFCEKILANLKTVKKLQKKIYMNLPTDKKFGNRLIKSLENILDEKLDSMKKEIESNIEMDKDKKRELLQEIAIFVELNEAEDNKSAEQDYSDSDQILSRTATPGPEKISAWPGSHHGHP